jgi:hypothetical protein
VTQAKRFMVSATTARYFYSVYLLKAIGKLLLLFAVSMSPVSFFSLRLTVVYPCVCNDFLNMYVKKM